MIIKRPVIYLAAIICGMQFARNILVEASCGDQQVFPELNFHPNPNYLSFPCDSTRRIYLSTKRYIPKNFLLTRAQIHQNVVYACAPRLKQGVPFSLAKMTLKKGQCVPQIEPYPCWSIQEEGNCQAVQSCIDLVHDPKVSFLGKIF